MLQPARTKYRRQQRGRHKGVANSGDRISFGEYALATTGRAILTGRQIEAARIVISREVRRGGKLWIRVFPDIPYTKKPAETRMGKGKGSPEYWVTKVKPGRILFEIAGVSEKLARSGMRKAAAKMPCSCSFVLRGELKQ